jgi:hypothetical protein
MVVMSAFGTPPIVWLGLACMYSNSLRTNVSSTGANTLTISLVSCGIYYFVWVKWLPKLKHYELRQIVLELEDGAVAHKLVKVPDVDIARWDAEHDVTG